MSVFCPTCHHQPLKWTQYENENVGLCPQCGGMWFEHASVNRMIEEINDGPVGECYQAHFGDHIAPSHHSCPQCQGDMQCHHLLQDYHVHIDVCASCDSVWLDKGEVDAVQHSMVLRESLTHLNDRINWKTWLFQFLSKMPVEYNVKPRIVPWVTYVLLALNVGIFAAYFFDDRLTAWVIDTFALWPNAIGQGQMWWGLLTSAFLHGSIMHLVGNMYFLYVVGDNLEDALGHWAFLGWYLLLALLSALASVLMSANPNIPSVGASGAIAGLFGFYLMWFRYASLSFMFVVYQKKLSAIWFFAIWLALDVFALVMLEDGVDHGAHIGGFVAGLLIGWWLKPRVEARRPVIRLLNQKEANISR